MLCQRSCYYSIVIFRLLGKMFLTHLTQYGVSKVTWKVRPPDVLESSRWFSRGDMYFSSAVRLCFQFVQKERKKYATYFY